MSVTNYELVVIGGGPSGMAAAVEAARCGLHRILLVERGGRLGGMLPQCIHDGFGLSEMCCSLTGPEYATIWREKVVCTPEIELLTDTMALSLEGRLPPYKIRISGLVCGVRTVLAQSVILAMGCRERTLGQLRIPGSRPAGIYTAGAAQYMINCCNYLPGRRAVILGSGDIGLIMARRLTMEGVTVALVLGEKASGQARNYVQCIADFHIPIRFGWTVLSTHGYRRLKGVSVAPLCKDGSPDKRRSAYVPCDTLLVAAGLIPETELWQGLGGMLSPVGGIPEKYGAVVGKPGMFACGNVVRIYDTADEVTEAGRRAGRAVAGWVFRGVLPTEMSNVAKSVCQGISREKLEQMLDGSLNQDTICCVLCPRSCFIRIEQTKNDLQVAGAGCQRGEVYAAEEVRAPKRTVTTTVPLAHRRDRLLPVRTDCPVPVAAIPVVLRQVRQLSVEGPIAVGQVLCHQVGGTEANLVVTDELDETGEE